MVKHRSLSSHSPVLYVGQSVPLLSVTAALSGPGSLMSLGGLAKHVSGEGKTGYLTAVLLMLHSDLSFLSFFLLLPSFCVPLEAS